MTRTIRASSLPLALACPASQVPPQARLADDSPESRLGSAVHEVLAAVVRDNIDGAAFSDANIAAAARWLVELTDVYDLAWNGRRAWDRLREHFPTPSVEHEFDCTFRGDLLSDEDFRLTGHVDVYSVLPGSESEFRLLDWKTGYEDADHEAQMRAYAWLGLRGWEGPGYARAFVVRLREMTVDTFVWTRAELNAWHEGVVRDTADVGQFRAGRHCGFCQRRVECPMLVAHMAATAVQMLDGTPERTMAMPQAMVCLYDRIRQLEDGCADARNLIRAHLAAFGPVVGHDGRTLALVRQERQEINSGLAWPVLENRFGLHAVAEAAKLTKTAVTKLAMDNAPPRGKGKAAKQIIEDLDAVGAITVNSIERLEIHRGNSDSIEAGDAAVSRPAIAGGAAAQTNADDA
jgi:hypothetical protein